MSPGDLTTCALAILAGGRGVRLGGVAKGLLRRGGRTLIEAQLSLGHLFDEVLVVANDPLPYAHLGVRIVPDRMEGHGAPGGLDAALCHARSEWVLALACDMPFVTPAVVGLLLGERGQGADVVACEVQGRLEPLPSLWRTALAPGVERSLPGAPSLRSLCERFRLRRIPESHLAGQDPRLEAVVSINRPEDLAAYGIVRPGTGEA